MRIYSVDEETVPVLDDDNEFGVLGFDPNNEEIMYTKGPDGMFICSTRTEKWTKIDAESQEGFAFFPYVLPWWPTPIPRLPLPISGLPLRT